MKYRQPATSDVSLEDYQWLVGSAGEVWLKKAASAVADGAPLVNLTRLLRKELSATRAHLVLEQLELRQRAGDKFSLTDRLFFTRKGLQQATDEHVADYKAQRFPAAEVVADLCCGIGGDLFGLGARGPVVAVDCDAVAVLLAAANCRALRIENVEPRCCDAAALELDGFEAWHMDPDRRTGERRTTTLEFYQPGLPHIERLLASRTHAAVKLAPATHVPPAWERDAEREWIESRGECRQQVAWFGKLAERAGLRRATVVGKSAAETRMIVGSGQTELPVATAIERYVYEPCSAVLAAGLSGTLAALHGVGVVAPGVAYLTGDEPIHDRLLASFEVMDVLPLDLKRIKQHLLQRRIGRLEVKKRGIDRDPEQVRRMLRVAGDHSATLLMTRTVAGAKGILARRCVPFRRG